MSWERDPNSLLQMDRGRPSVPHHEGRSGDEARADPIKNRTTRLTLRSAGRRLSKGTLKRTAVELNRRVPIDALFMRQRERGHRIF
jgi:hypothetical protein